MIDMKRKRNERGGNDVEMSGEVMPWNGQKMR